MSASLDPTNYSALQYNKANIDIVAGLCEPLFSNFGITSFVYSHFFNNGTYLDLCTHEKWQQHYIEYFAANEFVANYIRKIYKNKTRYVIWNNNLRLDQEQVSKKFIIDSCGFDIWHGFSIYKHHTTSIESWHFGTTQDNFKIINFYINHLDLLEHFICYFQNKASSLINTKDISKLVVLKNRTPLFDSDSIFDIR